MAQRLQEVNCQPVLIHKWAFDLHVKFSRTIENTHWNLKDYVGSGSQVNKGGIGIGGQNIVFWVL